MDWSIEIVRILGESQGSFIIKVAFTSLFGGIGNTQIPLAF